MRGIQTRVLQWEDMYGNKYDQDGWNQYVNDLLTKDYAETNTFPGEGWPTF